MALSGFTASLFPIDTFNAEFSETEVLQQASSAGAISISTGGGVSTNFPSVFGHPNATPSGHILTGTDKTLRHFTFVLNNGLGGGSALTSVLLNINPEDMSIDTPYRVNPVQTMGGAFVDVWGVGIRRLVIRGHTGFKTYDSATQVQDGYDNIFALRDGIINKYFDIRTQSVATNSQSEIEDKLKVIVIDQLHGTSYEVIPEVFRLLRNRARPLLHMYEASFIIRDNDKDPQALFGDDLGLLTPPTAAAVGDKMDGISDRFASIKDQLSDIGGPFKDALWDLTNSGGGIADTFAGILKAKAEFTQGVEGIRTIAAQATQAVNRGIGSLQSFADLSGIALDVKSVIYDTKSVYGELRCLLNEVKQTGLYVYTGIVGSSSCAALYGQPNSNLTNQTNSFDAILQSQQRSTIGQTSNLITAIAQNASDKIQQLDVPVVLANGGV
jgi:hypothetical protein